jgi:pyruvate ferredoxin oxidoreductase gamma subunit
MAELIAEAVFYDGKFSQAFPNFGVERRGAPVAAYVRIDDKYIRLRSQVYNPNFVIIQDASLIGGVDVFAGLEKGSTVLVNASKMPENINLPSGVTLKVISGTDLAMEIIGRPIINTILLGAFAGLSGLISIESVEKAIRERFSGEIGEKNVEAARRGYEMIK